ncbi:MAG: hypothetical protein WBM50_13340 [Acidimicrobiales bacterium]
MTWPSTSTFVRRLGIYVAAVMAASLIGVQLTGGDDGLPYGGVPAATYAAGASLGPALVILATAQLQRRAVAFFAAVAAIGMLTIWWLYANSTSSTAVFAFLLGWWIGFPVAVVSITDQVRSIRSQRTQSS